jgi:hypothetical protein
MRANAIVILSPVIKFQLRIFYAEKQVHVQTFIPKPTIKTLDIGVLHRLTGTDEFQMDSAKLSPLIHGLGVKRRSVVYKDTLRVATSTGNTLQTFRDILTAEGAYSNQGKAFAIEVVDDAQRPE